MPLLHLVRGKDTHPGLPAACILFLAPAIGVPAEARDAQTRFAVTATVEAVVRVDTRSVPNLVEVSAADVERGFIDVSEPLRLRVYSNSPGCALDIVTVTPMLSSMILKGLGSDQRLGSAGGTVVERWTPRTDRRAATELTLRFRLVLGPTVVPGSYPWPLRVFVRPLESPAA
jgi:hypothetical protein